MMPPKRPPPRKRQTTINFSPASKSSKQPLKPLVPSDSDEDETSPKRPEKRRRLDRETERGMRLGMPVQLSGRGMFSSSDVSDDMSSSTPSSSDTDSEIPVKANMGKKDKGKKKAKPKETREKLGSIQVAVPKKTRQRKSRQQQTIEEDSLDEIQVIPRKKHQPRNSRTQPIPVEDSDEQDEDDVPRIKSRRRQTTARVPTPEDIASDEEQSGSDQESNEDTPGNEDNLEDDELKEDLAFLRSSPVPDRGRLRSKGTKVKSEREKALEALKKRRAGTNEPSSSAATPGRKKPVIIESDSESGSDLQVIDEEKGEDSDVDNGLEEEDEIEDIDDDTTNAHDVFRETNEDGDFINDEEEGLIGAPAEDVRMPLAFTGLSTAKPRDLFKYAIEWSVHKKINPSFAADDEIYTLTFRKLDDEVRGLANSKFHSSQWTGDFSRAIKARPDFLANELSSGMKAALDPHCEACNRKNHVASWEISLTGNPYNYDTLEPLAEDSDNTDSDSSSSSSSLSSSSSAELNGEKPMYNEAGERIPPESKTFTLGSTCKANAQVAHTLYHWRYHLHGWVVGYLERQGYFKADQLVRREKWSDRKRSKKANKIVDQMEKDGEIKRLHRLYKQQVDFALEAKNEYTQGWGRRG